MHILVAIYTLTLFYAFHYALPLYSESTFLSSIIPESYIGIVYSTGAAISILLTLNIQKIINRYPTHKVLAATGLAEIVVLLGIVFSPALWITLLLFILKTVLLSLLFVSLNIAVESVSKDNDTGKIRGIYLTILSLGVLTGPFFASFFVHYGLEYLFLISAFCLAPVVYIAMNRLSHIPRPLYQAPNLSAGFQFVRQNPNIQKIIFIQYILEVFFILMIIYTPLYLIDKGILDLQTYLGVIIPIILIPFILIPYPLGKVADHKTGEKEFLILGLLLMVAGTLIFGLLQETFILYFVLALFLGRLGASMVEEMASSYFYKKVTSSDIHVISIFVNTRNFATLTAPLIGSAVVQLTSIQMVFWVLAGILIISLLPSLTIHDTK